MWEGSELALQIALLKIKGELNVSVCSRWDCDLMEFLEEACWQCLDDSPRQRIPGSSATLPFGASSLSLIGTSLEINENDILCSSCSRHWMLQKGPSQFITHSIYIAMALKHYLWDVNFLSAVNNLYRVEEEWKKRLWKRLWIYIYKGFLQWRGVLFEFKLPSRVFTFRSKLLCFPSSKAFLGSSVSLQHSVQPQGSDYRAHLSLRDPSRQEEEHKLLVSDSPRGVCVPIAVLCLFKCGSWLSLSGHISVMFSVGPAECPALSGKATSGETAESSGLSSPAEKSNLYKQTLSTGHKPRDTCYITWKECTSVAKDQHLLRSQPPAERWWAQQGNLHLPGRLAHFTLGTHEAVQRPLLDTLSWVLKALGNKAVCIKAQGQSGRLGNKTSGSLSANLWILIAYLTRRGGISHCQRQGGSRDGQTAWPTRANPV